MYKSRRTNEPGALYMHCLRVENKDAMPIIQYLKDCYSVYWIEPLVYTDSTDIFYISDHNTRVSIDYWLKYAAEQKNYWKK